MSTQDTAALIESVNNMTATVAGKIGEIDQRVNQAESEFDTFMLSAREENAIYRQSRNQFGNLTGTALDYFARNGGFTIDVTLHRTINTGVSWADRDPEEQEILTAMGRAGAKHFQPAIRVMKMVWSGFDSAVHSRYTIYPSPIGSISTYVTTASYAKLMSGDIRDMWLQGVNDQWGLCGKHFAPAPGAYLHAHPAPYSASGEVLFIWPGITSGHVPLDRNNPKWGYYPSMYGENPFDASPGA